MAANVGRMLVIDIDDFQWDMRTFSQRQKKRDTTEDSVVSL